MGGGKDAVWAAKTARAAAVIGDGDDGGEIADGLPQINGIVAAAGNVFLQTSQERGEAGAAAQCNHIKAAREALRIGNAFFHGKRCLNHFRSKNSKQRDQPSRPSAPYTPT